MILMVYAALLLHSGWVIGQEGSAREDTMVHPRQKNITVDENEVIKRFEARLLDAKKVILRADQPKVDEKSKKYTYDISGTSIEIKYPEPVIRPLAMRPDLPKGVNNFFAKAGYGTLSSPYVEASYYFSNGEDYGLLLEGEYYGVDDSQNREFRKFFDSDFGVSGYFRLGENHRFSGRISGQYDRISDYGFQIGVPDEDLKKKDVIKGLVGVRLENVEQTSWGGNYHIGLTGTNLMMRNMESGDERGVELDIGVEKWFGSHFSIFLDAVGDYYRVRAEQIPSLINVDRKSFTFVPGVRFSMGPFRSKISGDIFIDHGKDVSIFGDVEIGYSLLDGKLFPYAGIDQDASVNSIFEMYQLNKFIGMDALTLKSSGFPTTIARKYFVGCRGSWKGLVTFDIKSGYKQVDGFLYPESTGSGTWGYELIYNAEDLSGVFVGGDLHLDYGALDFGLSIHHFFVSRDIDNTPFFDYNLTAGVSFWDDKIHWTSGFGFGDKILIDSSSGSDTGNFKTDLSTGFEFDLTKNVGIWIQANNLFDVEYLRYASRPEIGRHFLGGVLVKF